MSQIEYCDTDSDREWEARPLLSTYCESTPQVDIDDWVFKQDKKWFTDELKAAPSASETLESLFTHHAQRWSEETARISSPAQMMMNPNYQAIMGMAQKHPDEVVRLMLVDLRDHRRLWLWALNFLTQANPVSRSQSGKLDEMIAAWVGWGRAKGIL